MFNLLILGDVFRNVFQICLITKAFQLDCNEKHCFNSFVIKESIVFGDGSYYAKDKLFPAEYFII